MVHKKSLFTSLISNVLRNRLICILFFFCAPLVSNAATEYSFGVFPYMPTHRMVAIYGPVASDFGHKLKATVRLKTAASFSKFESNLAKEIYDIALIQPFDYPNAIDRYHYLPVARISQDLVTEFVIRNDSKFTKLSDLIGKRIAFPSSRAAISQMGLAHLRRSGINPKSDVKVTYQKSHESCLQQVWLKKAFACVTARPMVKLFEQDRHVKFKVLTKAEVIPHALYVVHQRVSAEQRKRLKDLILSWNFTVNGKRMIKTMGFPGFSEVKDEQYEIMRDIIRDQSNEHTHQADISLLAHPASYLSKMN